MRIGSKTVMAVAAYTTQVAQGTRDHKSVSSTRTECTRPRNLAKLDWPNLIESKPRSGAPVRTQRTSNVAVAAPRHGAPWLARAGASKMTHEATSTGHSTRRETRGEKVVGTQRTTVTNCQSLIAGDADDADEARTSAGDVSSFSVWDVRLRVSSRRL